MVLAAIVNLPLALLKDFYFLSHSLAHLAKTFDLLLFLYHLTAMGPQSFISSESHDKTDALARRGTLRQPPKIHCRFSSHICWPLFLDWWRPFSKVFDAQVPHRSTEKLVLFFLSCLLCPLLFCLCCNKHSLLKFYLSKIGIIEKSSYSAKATRLYELFTPHACRRRYLRPPIQAMENCLAPWAL